MNKVVLIGRLTKDATFVQLDDSVRGAARFVLAIDRSFLNKNMEKETDFVSVVYWCNNIDKIKDFLSKGKLVGVSGKITTRSYPTEGTNKKYITQVEADSIQFLSGKKENVV